MLRNFIKTTFRNLLKNKAHAAINVIGLSLGMTCAVIIFRVIQFETSFEAFQENGDRIFRIVHNDTEFDTDDYSPGVPIPLPEALRLDFPEIDALTIVDSNFGSVVISVERPDGSIARFEEEQSVSHVNQDYLRMFTMNWLAGNPESALANPKSAVISRSLAQKYFGDENPLGKQLTYNNRLTFQVTGLIEDMPENTEMPLNLLLAFDTKERGSDNWGSISGAVQCYMMLPEHINSEQIDARLHDFFAKHRSEERAQHFLFWLQPLREMHFDQRFGTFGDHVTARETLWALCLIGVFLIITACINFVNLNTAVAIERAKEVGVRKVLGGTRRQLATQFLGETALITFAAIAISIAAVEIVMPQMKTLLGYPLSANIFADAQMGVFLLTLFALVTISAGFYPALYLSGFSPIDAIRQKVRSQYGDGLRLRKGLVIVQIAISQVMIIGTIVISKQMDFFRSYDMGFNKDAIVEISLPDNERAQIERLKSSILQNPTIRSMAYSNTGTASNNTWNGNYKLTDGEELRKGDAQIKFVDEDFLETYSINLIAGKNLTAADTVSDFLVSQAFVEEVGYGARYHDIIGRNLTIWGRSAPIVGVVKNFNTTSLHDKMPPVVLAGQNRYQMAAVKIDMKDVSATLESIEQAWTAVYPEFVYDFAFLDESIEHFYEEEQATSYLINAFAAIAILIGCLGLFGLISYMASRRTKEIGIRKVLGATFTNVLTLLSKELTLLAILAFVVAAPVAYYLMQSWLADFAYRIELGAGLLGYALLASCALVLLTVGYKSVRVALANPVDSLRCE